MKNENNAGEIVNGSVLIGEHLFSDVNKQTHQESRINSDSNVTGNEKKASIYCLELGISTSD